VGCSGSPSFLRRQLRAIAANLQQIQLVAAQKVQSVRIMERRNPRICRNLRKITLTVGILYEKVQPYADRR
jgi:hypothetical protein